MPRFTKCALSFRFPYQNLYAPLLSSIYSTCPNHLILQNTFIVPTDAYYYKIIKILKQFKIIILALTCFGSCRNHHQGAVLCLAKITNMVFLCSSV
jgi:hypothetical protein